MSTIALKQAAAKEERKTRNSRKAKEAAHTSTLTEKLREALEDVKNDRIHTVEPEHYREGFKELLKKEDH